MALRLVHRVLRLCQRYELAYNFVQKQQEPVNGERDHIKERAVCRRGHGVGEGEGTGRDNQQEKHNDGGGDFQKQLLSVHHDVLPVYQVSEGHSDLGFR